MTAERELQLSDRRGRRLSVQLREYETGEEKELIACIVDEYGDTYFRKSLYLPENLRRETRSGRAVFLVAEVLSGEEAASGELAGMLILKQSCPEAGICEMASLIFRKKYRGYGLAMPFLEYGINIIKSRGYVAAYGLAALFHNTTQRLLCRLGLRATGFVLNILDMGRITYSYKKDRNQKHPGGIQVLALGKRDAGVLYLPREHREFCQRIYDSLEVKCRICSNADSEGPAEGLGEGAGASEIHCIQDKGQSSLEIRIRRVGADLRDRLAEIREGCPLTGLQTANVFLNIHDRFAVWAYRRLEEMGYFFTGLQPLCGESEYMVLHNPGNVKIYPEEYVVTGEFSLILAYVKECYQRAYEKKAQYHT